MDCGLVRPPPLAAPSMTVTAKPRWRSRHASVIPSTPPPTIPTDRSAPRLSPIGYLARRRRVVSRGRTVFLHESRDVSTLHHALARERGDERKVAGDGLQDLHL